MYGCCERLFCHRSKMERIAVEAMAEFLYSGMYESKSAIIRVAYGQQSSFFPGPLNFPNSGETAQGNPFSRRRDIKCLIPGWMYSS